MFRITDRPDLTKAVYSGCKESYIVCVKYTTSTDSFKSNENIQRKEGGPDKSVSNNKFQSVALNELVMKARGNNCTFRNKAVDPYTSK